MFMGVRFGLDAGMEERTYRVYAAVLVLCAAGLRLLGLEKGIWQDEGSSIALIRQADFWNALRGYDHPPFYFALLRGWAQISDAEPFLRLLSVPFSLLIIAVVMSCARRVSPRAALLAGWMAACLPVMLRYGQEIRGYALLLAATALAFYFATRIANRPDERWSYFGLAASLVIAALTHLVGIFLPGSIAAYLLTAGRARGQGIRIHWITAVFALAAAVFCGVYFLFMDASIRSRGGGTWGDEISPGLVLFTMLFYSGVFTFQPNLLGGGGVWNMTGITAVTGILGSISGLFLTRNRMAAAMLVGALAFWGQEMVVALTVAPVFSERAGLPGLVPLIVCAAVQMAEIPSPPVRKIVITCAVLLGAMSAGMWVAQDAWKPLEPWRELSSAVSSLYRSGDTILVYPGYAGQPLSYYLDTLPVEELIYLPYDDEEPDIKRMLGQHQPAGGRVLLITRLDGNVERDWGRYARLLDDLDRAAGEAVVSSHGNLRLSVYPGRN